MKNKQWGYLILFSFSLVVLSGCTANVDSGVDIDEKTCLFDKPIKEFEMSEGFGNPFLHIEFEDGSILEYWGEDAQEIHDCLEE